MMPTLVLDGAPLSIADVDDVARRHRPVALAEGARNAIARSRRVVESHLADGQAHYGINTGFGSLSRTRISPNDLATLQRNLVRSHAAGMGPCLPRDVVRGMMVVLSASLTRGLSGVRVELVEHLVRVLNAGIVPVVPETGSVGASGDLAPLAHIALTLLGEGEAFAGGVRTSAAEALRLAGLTPISLAAKEGLALINGTHLMAASAALIVRDTERLVRDATVACAMSIDACKATDAFLDDRLYAARVHPGPREIARRLRELLSGSEIITSHRVDDPRVQDPYSLRCAPQVLGASLDAIAHVRACVERELGAVTDNPLVFSDGAGTPIVSGGNFHGMPVALPIDHLTPAIAHIAGIAERRVFFLLSATDPVNPVPPYLAPNPGLNSGLMIAQYTAAACVNEIAGLSMPASVVNIPTSAGIEDYNSFGPRACAKAIRAVELARRVVAIELLCAAQGLEGKRPLRSGAGVEVARDAVRARVPSLTDDRPISTDLQHLEEMLTDPLVDDPFTKHQSIAETR